MQPKIKEVMDLHTLSEGTGKEETIYTQRFSVDEDLIRRETWKILCRDFFQKFIASHHTVIDIGAGDGNFIRNIKAARRVALDLSPHVRTLMQEGIEVLQVPASELSKHFHGEADIIFMSNFLEHLPNKNLVLNVFEECFQVLKPGGSLLILQPNIRFVGAAYWDYIDHHIALTEKSLEEALLITGYQVAQIIPKFLPYTVKSRLGSMLRCQARSLLIRSYLQSPFLWRIFGKQTFIVAKKNA